MKIINFESVKNKGRKKRIATIDIYEDCSGALYVVDKPSKSVEDEVIAGCVAQVLYDMIVHLGEPEESIEAVEEIMQRLGFQGF